MPLTVSSEVVANYIFNMINTGKVGLGINAVYYGDQTQIPTTPAVCVAPGNKQRQFQGASYTTLNTLETYVFLYYGKVQDVQLNLHAAQAMADSLEPFVQADLKLGGNVIAVLCTQNEPGMINKMGSLMVGNRLTFESMTKTMLP